MDNLKSPPTHYPGSHPSPGETGGNQKGPAWPLTPPPNSIFNQPGSAQEKHAHPIGNPKGNPIGNSNKNMYT